MIPPSLRRAALARDGETSRPKTTGTVISESFSVPAAYQMFNLPVPWETDPSYVSTESGEILFDR